jgi:hypothetical protein
VRSSALCLLMWGLAGASFSISKSDAIGVTFLFFLLCIYFHLLDGASTNARPFHTPFLADSLAGSFCRRAFQFDPDVSTERDHFS